MLEVSSLTALGIYQRLKRLRPSPSRLERGPSHRSPANIYEFQFSLFEGPHLIRPIQAFSFHSFHPPHLLILSTLFSLSVKRCLRRVQLSREILAHRQIG